MLRAILKAIKEIFIKKYKVKCENCDRIFYIDEDIFNFWCDPCSKAEINAETRFSHHF